MIVFDLIFLLYVIFIFWLLWGYWQIKIFNRNKSLSPQTSFSIIIPFKNEAQHLDRLLKSLQAFDYPKDLIEIWMIDDHSTDNSVEIIKKYTFAKLLTNRATGKKKALETGITQSRSDWIITTDADTVMPPAWLKTFDVFITQNNPKMILGPVKYIDSNRFIAQFQQMEFLSLQALTMASLAAGRPFLANGANLVFLKKAFYQVGAYQGNAHLASGDDVFLLEKFHKAFPKQILFLKSQQVLVQTKAMPTWKDLWQQKIRWAGKAKHQKSFLGLITGSIILLTQAGLIASLFWYETLYWFILGKLILDALLLAILNRFYKAKLNPVYFMLSFFLYPWYFILVFLSSLKGGYVWKGRQY